MGERTKNGGKKNDRKHWNVENICQQRRQTRKAFQSKSPNRLLYQITSSVSIHYAPDMLQSNDHCPALYFRVLSDQQNK